MPNERCSSHKTHGPRRVSTRPSHRPASYLRREFSAPAPSPSPSLAKRRVQSWFEPEST